MDVFEDHCWRDVVPADVLELYSHYRRDIAVGPSPALLAIDLYELVYQGGARPVAEVSKQYPSSCGVNAWNAIEPTRRLFAAARAAGIPVIYSTRDTHADVRSTLRRGSARDPKLYAIRPEFQPAAADIVIRKQRASAFFETPLKAHLEQLGVRTLIVFGESTSGCVRASAVDAYSHGYQAIMAEECCFDRSELSHKVSLFDLHHKYAGVMRTADIIEQLAR